MRISMVPSMLSRKYCFWLIVGLSTGEESLSYGSENLINDGSVTETVVDVCDAAFPKAEVPSYRLEDVYCCPDFHFRG